jgi:hypothetical protein
LNSFGPTARNIIKNCGIEYAVEVAEYVLDTGKSLNVEWHSELTVYIRRRVNSHIANAIKIELSSIT